MADPDARPPSRLRRFTLDIEPLRVSRDFRLIWAGLSISELGYQFTLVAIYVQVYAITGSAGAVGLTGLFSFLALLLGGVVSGTVIDAYDRRTLLLVAQLGFAVGSGLLLAGAIFGPPPVWLIYLGASILALVSTIDSPTRSAMAPRLVGRDLMPSAAALNQVVWNGVGLLGPALGGIVIARFGVPWAYGIDMVTYGAMFAAALMIARMPPGVEDAVVATGWTAVREGFSFVRASRLLKATFSVDLVAMIFGLPRALFPVLAVTQFHRGTEIVGLMFSAPAAGALLGAVTGGWVRHIERQGMAVVFAVITWGAAIAAFGLSGSNLPLALGFLAIAGAGDVISAILRSTILQLSAPDELRGRLNSIHILVVTGGPRLGDLEAGLVAQWFNSATFSVVSGGLICIVGAIGVAMGYPEFRRYRRTDPSPGASGRAPSEP